MDFLDSRSNLLNHQQKTYLICDPSIRSISLYPGHLPYPFIFNQDGQLFEGGLDDFLFWIPTCIWRKSRDGNFEAEATTRLEHVRSHIDQEETKKDHQITQTYNKLVYLCHPFGSYAYGHLFDTLLRLYTLDADSRNNWGDYAFIVSDYSKITDFIHHLNALTGTTIRANQLIKHNPKVVYRCDTLLYGLPVSYEAQLTPDSYRWLIKRYRKYFLGDTITISEVKIRLYLSRNHIVTGQRGVLNEYELIPLLLAKGYKVLTGDEPLFQIVRFFHIAEVVTGAHGSLFANTIFCQPIAKIVEFCPNNRIDKSFMNKIKEAHDYTQVPLEADADFNITIPLGFFE